MKTKICTTFEQSKKLIELGIDANTADMTYLRVYLGEERDYILLTDSYPEEYTEKDDGSLIPVYDEHIPAWSLTSLLELMPKIGANEPKLCKRYYTYAPLIRYVGMYGLLKETKEYDNPIDACYEMVVWLKEINPYREIVQAAEDIDKAWDAYWHFDGCEGCVGNGCDDCRDCEEASLKSNLYKKARNMEEGFKNMYGITYREYKESIK